MHTLHSNPFLQENLENDPKKSLFYSFGKEIAANKTVQANQDQYYWLTLDTQRTVSRPFFLALHPPGSGLPLLSTPNDHAQIKWGITADLNNSDQILSPETIW